MRTPEPETYTEPAKLLHWLVVGLVAMQFVLAEMAEHAQDSGALLQQLALLANHKSLGLTVLGLVLVRLFWRMVHPPPDLPDHMPVWQIFAAKLTHTLFYVLLFALPLSGWLMSSASAYSVSWFNLVELPNLVEPDEALKERLQWLHELLGTGLLILALVHVLGAFKHLLVDRFNLLARMFSYVSIGVAVIAIIAALPLLRVGQAPVAADSPSANPTRAASDRIPINQTQITHSDDVAEPAQVADLSPWPIDYTRSEITFYAEQAGAQFKGVWRTWDAEIYFDPANLAKSRATVRIDTSDVSSEDAERDATIIGADFFNAVQFPSAVFQTQAIAVTPGGYQARATLTIKDISAPVVLDFTVSKNPDGTTLLVGTTQLDRLVFNVGVGDWVSTEWVGQLVDVHIGVTKSVRY
jgi:cytochrome b561/polyisoprenoid-binding protein YceI